MGGWVGGCWKKSEIWPLDARAADDVKVLNCVIITSLLSHKEAWSCWPHNCLLFLLLVSSKIHLILK